MQPNSSNYSNHKVHVNPVFSYLANKYAYSSATMNTCSSPQTLDRKQSHPSEQSHYTRKADTPFNNYIKGKFYELSAIMYQDSINKATSSTQDTNTLPQQDQNSKYRWKNQKLTAVCDTPLVNESVPFHSVFSKGWFFHNSCDTKCIANSSLDVQSCCFINDRCLPRNTLDTQELKKRVLDFYKKKTSSSSNHSLISISKHKLIKKTNIPLKETPAGSKSPVSQKRKSLNVPLLCTRSKLIRRKKPVAISMSLVKAQEMMMNASKNFIVKRHSLVRINNASEEIAKTMHKRKRLNSVIMLTKSKLIRKNSPIAQTTSPFVSISKHKLRRKIVENPSQRKLIRKNSPIAQNTSPFVSISKHKLRRKIVENTSPVISTPKPEFSLAKVRNEPATSAPDRLISINPNKLVKSSLLTKMNKSKNEVFFAKSVLFHVIRYRRRSHRGSGYVLLTRNKLIKKAKFKNRIWSGNKSEESSPNNCPNKVFVALGSNKLIRKSLFAKNNKTDTEKKSSQILPPVKNALFARMWNSPSRRIQRFTNHLARTKLRYASERSTSMFKNRFPNKHKNNMRIIRKKKNNSICPIYRKKGTCAKLLKGDCFRIHDRKYVALCQNFIRGNCDEKDCLLSHDLCPNKISVCRRYLKNSCTYENCPYLHSKPALESPICPQFLQGYCESGERCTKWHIFACPEFKESSRCPKEGTCSLPHRDSSYFQGKADDSDDEDGFNWRYFEKNKIDEKDNKSISIIPERQLMGDLPDYIPI